MTRHSRNQTSNPVYSYAERKKDGYESGYGTTHVRLGADSIKGFDCCALTLQPCNQPVITPEGVLFDKEAILEFILQQKKLIGRKRREFDEWQNKLAAKVKVEQDEQLATKVARFVEQASCVLPALQEEAEASTKHNAYWVPERGPDNKDKFLTRPDEKVRCPITCKVLRLKDLHTVVFKRANEDPDEAGKSDISREVRYQCAISNDVLGNSTPCVVLRTSGNVVTQDCFDKIIKKEMIDPTNGAKLTPADVIKMQRGGVAFSGSGVQVEAKKYNPVMSMG